MKRFRTIRHIILLGAVMLLTGCNGILGGIYDEPPADSEEQSAFTKSESAPGAIRLTLDARSYTEWHYIDLRHLTVTTLEIPSDPVEETESDGRSGWTYNLVHGDQYTPLSTFATASQPEPESWDFAIHHFDIKTNGGSAYATPYMSLDKIGPDFTIPSEDRFTPDVWSTTHVITDLNDMMAFRIGYQNSYVNEVLSGWMDMDITNPPPVYTTSGRVYLLRTADGYTVAIKFTSYMSASGVKGYLTLDILPLSEPSN